FCAEVSARFCCLREVKSAVSAIQRRLRRSFAPFSQVSARLIFHLSRNGVSLLWCSERSISSLVRYSIAFVQRRTVMCRNQRPIGAHGSLSPSPWRLSRLAGDR